MFTVDIELNGKTETLKTSLRAARTINGACGDFMNALDGLNKFNMTAYTIIIAAGLDKKPSDVEEAVFSTGLVELTGPLSRFVNALAHGGRDPDAKTEGGAPVGER